jgi:hypothetical protein
VPQNTYSVSLQVADAQGTLAAQSDFGLPAEENACSRAIIPLKGLAPGTYTMRAILYNWHNGQRLNGQNLVHNTSGEQPIFGQIVVDQNGITFSNN